MQLVISRLDKKANRIGSLEQQTARDPLERGELVEQEDDSLTKEEKIELKL